MSPALADFLFQAVNFLLLLAALSWLFLKPLRRRLAEEQQREQAQQSALEQRTAELDARAQQLSDAEAQAAEARATARAQVLSAAQQEAQRLQDEAKLAVEQIRDRARHAQAAEREAALFEQVESTAKLAAGSVRALLQACQGPELDLALTRLACRSLLATPLDVSAHFSSVSSTSAKPIVESASELSADARALINQRLPNGFESRVNPALIAGVRILSEAGQIDASARGLSQAAAAQLQQRLQSPAPPSVPASSEGDHRGPG